MLLTFNSWEILVCDEVSLLGTVCMGYDVLLLLSPRYILCIVLWFVSWSSRVGPLCLKQADGDAFTILCVSSSMQSVHIPKLIFLPFIYLDGGTPVSICLKSMLIPRASLGTDVLLPFWNNVEPYKMIHLYFLLTPWFICFTLLVNH